MLIAKVLQKVNLFLVGFFPEEKVRNYYSGFCFFKTSGNDKVIEKFYSSVSRTLSFYLHAKNSKHRNVIYNPPEASLDRKGS